MRLFVLFQSSILSFLFRIFITSLNSVKNQYKTRKLPLKHTRSIYSRKMWIQIYTLKLKNSLCLLTTVKTVEFWLETRRFLSTFVRIIFYLGWCVTMFCQLYFTINFLFQLSCCSKKMMKFSCCYTKIWYNLSIFRSQIKLMRVSLSLEFHPSPKSVLISFA